MFISVEGIDGAGKSTHLSFIADYLRKCGKEVVVTREPGGTINGERIRELLLHKHDGMHRVTELLLMFASRQELIHNLILPNLDKGVWVISDRFIDASVAYQGVGRAIGVDVVNQVANILEPKIKTDLTLLFDISLEVAVGRITNSRDKDRIESAPKEFFANVQNAYHDILKNEPDRVKLITTDQSINKTQQTIMNHLNNLINKS